MGNYCKVASGCPGITNRGHCVLAPEICAADCPQVCGCDGKSYCTSVASEGACGHSDGKQKCAHFVCTAGQCKTEICPAHP